MFRNPTTDLIVVLVIVLLFVGPKRLPGLGRGIGQGMREFKDGITGGSKDSESDDPPELTRGSEPGAIPTTPATDRQPVAPARDSADVGSDRSS